MKYTEDLQRMPMGKDIDPEELEQWEDIPLGDDNRYVGLDDSVIESMSRRPITNPELQMTLGRNQEAVLETAKGVATAPTRAVDTEGLASAVSQAVAKADYSTAIRTLNELRDAKNGIAWTRDEASHTVVRDARNANDPVAVDGPEAYAMQYLNVTRGAITLLQQAVERRELSGNDANKAIQKLEQSAVAFCQNINNVHGAKDFAKAIKQGNSHIVDVVSGALGIKESDAKKRLNTAKDFSNFQDTHYHMVTLTTVDHAGKKYTTFEADVALLGLTDSQQAEYDRINGPNGPDWYQAMPQWEQDLVQGAKAAITDGQHVIPTQLRSNTVGIRNAYNKVSGVLNKGEMDVAHTMLHSGTVASESRADKQRVADMNVAQQEAFVGGPVHCVTLNTPVNPTGNDKSIVSQTANATEANGASHSNLAFNSLRRLNPNKYDGINKALGEIADNILIPELKDYLQGKGSKDKAENAIAGITDPETKRTLGYIIEINDLMHNNASPLDPENRNLRIGTCLSMIVDAVNGNKLDARTIGEVGLDPLVTMCQSGKDRDGLLLFSTATEAIGNKLSDISGQDVDRAAVRQAHANSGHTQQMAGGDGGSKGCFGIKKDTLGAIPEQWHDIAGTLSQATGSFNKFKTEEKPGLFDRFVTWVKELFGIEDKSKDAPSIVDSRDHSQAKSKTVDAPVQGKSRGRSVDDDGFVVETLAEEPVVNPAKGIPSELIEFTGEVEVEYDRGEARIQERTGLTGQDIADIAHQVHGTPQVSVDGRDPRNDGFRKAIDGMKASGATQAQVAAFVEVAKQSADFPPKTTRTTDVGHDGKAHDASISEEARQAQAAKQQGVK